MAKVKDLVKDMSDELGALFEEVLNTMEMLSINNIFKFMTTNDWRNKQLQNAPAFKRSLTAVARFELFKINEKYEKSLVSGFKAMNPDDQNAVKRAHDLMKNIEKENADMMAKLSNKIIQKHNQFVNQVQFDSSGKYEIDPLNKTNDLYDNIKKVLDSKEAQEEIKVAYTYHDKNNPDQVHPKTRQVPYKSYMEMNARTTLNQEISKYQMESAPGIGVVFWLVNGFCDCRPAHMNYQGKVYYDERWESYGYNEEMTKKIQDAIASRGMVSRQSVENGPPFLGNTPNCRHEFIAVPISDVVSMTDKQLLEDNNWEYDQASQDKYYASQEQRSLERKIRRSKFEIEKQKEILKNAPNGDQEAQNKLNREQQRLKDTRYKMKTLLDENPYLERDYSRESVKILREDLGYRANKVKTP